MAYRKVRHGQGRMQKKRAKGVRAQILERSFQRRSRTRGSRRKSTSIGKLGNVVRAVASMLSPPALHRPSITEMHVLDGANHSICNNTMAEDRKTIGDRGMHCGNAVSVNTLWISLAIRSMATAALGAPSIAQMLRLLSRARPVSIASQTCSETRSSSATLSACHLMALIELKSLAGWMAELRSV